MILRQDLEKMLTELEEKEKLVNMALSHCPPGQLMLTRQGGQLSYVQVITINGYDLVPDFALLSIRNEIFYWEHCGLTGNKEYMRHHKWKLEQYETAGIVPWKNLIITYDDEQGNIDLRIIESEIRNKLL